MNELRWQLTRAQTAALAFAFAFGMAFITAVVVHHNAKAEIQNPDVYSEEGWFEVLESDEDPAVRWNAVTGESWALACPGIPKSSCDWDPIEYREGAPNPLRGAFNCLHTGQGVIMLHVPSGNSWILACPGTVRTCDWEPLEVRTED